MNDGYSDITPERAIEIIMEIKERYKPGFNRNDPYAAAEGVRGLSLEDDAALDKAMHDIQRIADLERRQGL